MAKTSIGTCSECGSENVEVTAVDEDTCLCEDCLDELDYIECHNCHEFWLWDAVKFYELKDGRTLCEDCAEQMLEDKELYEDDIENIRDYT